MSQNKLREEKNCLNCGSFVEDRYCTHCGQENLKIQDSAFHLIIDYIQDIFHYDGRFWHTLKSLILRPGLVAKEYMEGKRRRNLEPLRVYLFASSIFFLLLFYFVSTAKWNPEVEPALNYKKRLYNLNQEKKYLKGSDDTCYVNLLRETLKGKLDSLNGQETDTIHSDMKLELSLPETKDTSATGWLEKWMDERADERVKELAKKHEGDENSAATDILTEAFHKLPQLLFFSMPFFALFLKLLYIRRARHNYVKHFIFSIYYYSYLFMILTVLLVIQYGMKSFSALAMLSIFNYTSAGLVIYVFLYLLLSMKRFYNDQWTYLIPRYLLLFFLSLCMLIVLFLVNIFVTYMW